MTYTTLLSSYTGALTGAALTAASSAAWGYLLGQTLGRITGVEAPTEAITQCFTAHTDMLAADEAGLSAETVGDFRREYRDTTGGKTQLQRAASLISQYLGGTDLLYRGTEP